MRDGTDSLGFARWLLVAPGVGSSGFSSERRLRDCSEEEGRGRRTPLKRLLCESPKGDRAWAALSDATRRRVGMGVDDCASDLCG